eukprot:g29186.t1
MLPGFWLLWLLPLPSTARQCFRAGWGFQEPLTEETPTKVSDAATCQAKCQATPSCAVFTFDTTSEDCALQGHTAVPLLLASAISGPRRCSQLTLPDALQQTFRAIRAAGSDAERAADAALGSGARFGLSNLQKAQMKSIALGRHAAMQAALKGLSETEQIHAAARAAEHGKEEQAIFAAGGVASLAAPTSDSVTRRASYAMLMALDVVAPNRVNVHVTDRQLRSAAQLGALVVALDGANTQDAAAKAPPPMLGA